MLSENLSLLGIGILIKAIIRTRLFTKIETNCQLLPSDLLITQMEVTGPQKGHWEEPGAVLFSFYFFTGHLVQTEATVL